MCFGTPGAGHDALLHHAQLVLQPIAGCCQQPRVQTLLLQALLSASLAYRVFVNFAVHILVRLMTDSHSDGMGQVGCVGCVL